MQQLEFQETTTFRWWRDNGEEIVESHKPELEELAHERIKEMRYDGYTGGELLATLGYPDSYGNPVDIEYRGWWELNTKNTS